MKRAVLVWHRRAGKDVACLNLILRQAIKTIGAYYYILPTYRQARLVIFEGMTMTGQKFLDYIPEELVRKINIQEMKITLINGSNIYFLGSDNYDCFDDKTEILSENGWKLFKDLDKNESVATLKNGFLSYDVPTKYHQYNYDGELYGISTSSVDFRVTPNHKFYVRSGKGFYKFKEISDPTIRHDMIPSQSKWAGRYTKKILGYDAEDFVALLGIYLAEGSAYAGRSGYQVSIAQVKTNIRREIVDLFKRMGLNPCICKDKIQICNKNLFQYFSQFRTQEHRFIPKDIKALSRPLLQILFDWLVKGDGHSCSTYTAYYSTSKQLIDDVQEIVLKLGLSGNVHVKPQSQSMIRGSVITSKKILYEVRIRKSKFKRLQGANSKPYIFQEYYKGKVYCVTVPSGVIKVRRNGKEIWSGNSLRGSNPKGIVFSEYAFQHPSVYPTLRPVLVANDGWCVFISTPFGENHFYKLYEIAKNSDEWFHDIRTVEDTEVISPEQIEKEENEGLMSADMIQQEYYCSFQIGAIGSFYSKYLIKMELNDQIGSVPWEPAFPVFTAWDLGVRDSTVIIFFQVIGTTVHIIDLYSNDSVGLEHYVSVVFEKNYQYAKHFAPHDIMVKEFGSGVTRLDKARELGIKFEIRTDRNMRHSAVPNVSIMDGIETVRSTLPKMWIDEGKCKDLITAIRDYRREYDAKNKVYKSAPLHNANSHFADSLRYLCLALPRCSRRGTTPEELDRRYREAVLGVDQSNYPAIFRDDIPQY